MAKELPGFINGALQVFESHGIGRLHDVFAVALSPEEQLKLEILRSDLPKWVEEALRLVQARFGPLPRELVERLRLRASEARRQ